MLDGTAGPRVVHPAAGRRRRRRRRDAAAAGLAAEAVVVPDGEAAKTAEVAAGAVGGVRPARVHPLRRRRRPRRGSGHRPGRLRRRDLAARRAGGAGADHPARHGRRRGRRQDRHQHRRGQEPGRRLPPAGRRARRPGRAGRRCPRPSSGRGLAEVVKCGFIADPRDPRAGRGRPGRRDRPAHRASWSSGRSGSRPTSWRADLHEAGRREILNYGHTLAHAIEQVEGYRWRHGEAVAVGLVFAAELAGAAGRLDDADADRHRDGARRARACRPATTRTRWATLLAAMRVDKKTRGASLRFVVLDGLGNPPILTGPDPACSTPPGRPVVGGAA